MAAARARLGFPSPADDFMDDAIDLHRLLVRNPAATFLYRADGWSMNGAGVSDGDILVVDRSVTPLAGDLVIAIAMPGDARDLDVRQRGLLIQPTGRFVTQSVEAKIHATRRDKDPLELAGELARHAGQGQRAPLALPEGEQPPAEVTLLRRELG